MSKTIPRINSDEVKRILADDELNDFEKAQEIHRYDLDMTCRETDGNRPRLMDVNQIEQLVREYRP